MTINILATFAILFLLLCIITSLAMGLYYLVKDQGKSPRTAKALSVRIILSLLLFIALVLAFAFGLISPHPLMGWSNTPATQSNQNFPPGEQNGQN